MFRKIVFSALVVGTASAASVQATAAAVDVYYRAGLDNKRSFAKDYWDPKQRLNGCGYVFVKSLGGGEVVKGNAYLKLERADEPSADGIDAMSYVSDFSAEVGVVDASGNFTAVPTKKVLIKTKNLSRYANVNEFPSGSIQLGGHFLKNILNDGFNLNIEYEDGAKKEAVFSAEEIGNKVQKTFSECIAKTDASHLNEWVEKTGKPHRCFYDKKFPGCE